jgi:hypothetical protein
MKMLTKLCVALVAVMALSAGTALADTWNVNGSPVLSPTSVSGTYILEFAEKVGDTELLLSCEMTQKGSVETEGVATITSITSTAGKSAIGCTVSRDQGGRACNTAEVEAGDLPWTTKLMSIAGLENRLTEETGPPHWRITCHSGAEKSVNECKPGGQLARVENLSSGLVQLKLRGSQEYGCLGYPIHIEGVEKLELVAGGKLSAAT